MTGKAASLQRQEGARSEALEELGRALERVLALGLTDLPPAALEHVKRRFLQERGWIHFSIELKDDFLLVCQLAGADRADLVELFRVELPAAEAAKGRQTH
jgi:hypothetical protein